MAVQRRLLGKRDCIFRRVPAAQRTFAHQVRRNRRDSLCLNCSKSANISYSSGRMKTENRFMCISPKESRLHLRPKYGSHNREAVCWQITTAASPIRIWMSWWMWFLRSFFLICRKWKEHFVLILYPFTVNQKSTAHFWAADLLLAGWMEQNLDGTIK